MPKMGNANDESATDMTRHLIGHDLGETLRTKEATTTSIAGNHSPDENASRPWPNKPETRPANANGGSTEPLQAINPEKSDKLAVSERSTPLVAHEIPPPASALPPSLPSKGTSLVPISALMSSEHDTVASFASSEITYQASSRRNVEDAEDDAAFDRQEEQNAIEQAEDGSIIVDSDDVATDAGYESDSHTAASTSLADSVRDYIYENGRRYHRFREGRYNFPNDDVEQQREDMKHAMVKMLCGQLYFAPLGDGPQQILDIGTGTGIWAIEMGDLFESASVLGVDLSPIQPEWVPPNVRFMVDDVESPWLHPRNCFDYIHARHTVMAIKNWPRLLRRAIEHMRPGGWFEFQEVLHYPISHNGTMAADHPVAKFWELVHQGLSNLGVDFHAVAGGRLANTMRECGYVNVSERTLQIPIGTWPKNKVLKTVGLYWRTILLDGLQAIALGPLMRGCGWSREQVEVFLVQVRRAYHDNSSLMYMPLHIIYGQKPESHY